MTSHPDADQFMRVYLRNPTDATTRLVFADWLEESGDPSNTAWAHFIRARVTADAQRPGSPERREWDTEAGKFAPFIRANLTIPAGLFVGYPKSLLQLLPGPNITVRLAGFDVPRATVELMPESVARENLVIALDHQPRLLLVAAAEPWNCDLVDKLQFILNRDTIAVRAEPDDIQDAINHHYGKTETESVDCVSYESPLIGLEGDEASSAIFGIFHTAFSQNCSGFEIGRTDSGCVLRYAPRRHPVPDEYPSREVFSRLLDHLLSLPIDAEYTDDGNRCLDFDIPLLSGRRFPATLERRPAEHSLNWFRLRFRWEDRG